MSEKTHAPTESKLKEARRKGQVPRSKLFNASWVVAGALLGVAATAAQTGSQLMHLLASVLRGELPSPSGALEQSLALLVRGAGPALVGAAMGALLPATASAGLHLSTESVQPSLEKLNPVAGLKRLVSLEQVLEVAKASFAAAIVALVVAHGLAQAAPDVVRTTSATGLGAAAILLASAKSALVDGALALIALGFADMLLARRSHLKKLMMTREEVKQEHKNSEGDPHHKAKRKAEHQKLAQGGPARGVRSATAVVVNPTHLAVALRYAVDECETPYIVARGREADAAQIREEARAAGIPIVRDVPLARSLIHYDVGEEVPEELYQAAAAVLRVALDAQTAPRSSKGTS